MSIEELRANPLNRLNAMHVPEIVRYAKIELDQAKRLPEKTNEQKKVKNSRVEAATRTLEERTSKLKMFQEAFPDLFNNSL